MHGLAAWKLIVPLAAIAVGGLVLLRPHPGKLSPPATASTTGTLGYLTQRELPDSVALLTPPPQPGSAAMGYAMGPMELLDLVGMLMQLGARSVSGAALVTEEVGLVHALRSAGLCITAEGRIDRQTLSGKIVGHVADLCRASGVQCIAVGGIVEPAAAEELERRGCETHKQGDMERAGRELASRDRLISSASR